MFVAKVTSRSLCFYEVLTSVTPVAERFYEVPNMYLPMFCKKMPVRSRVYDPYQAVTLYIAQIYVSLLHLMSRALVRFTENYNTYGTVLLNSVEAIHLPERHNSTITNIFPSTLRNALGFAQKEVVSRPLSRFNDTLAV